jgi:hypothetical protein
VRGFSVVIVLVALVGCEVKEEDFSSAYADATCDQLFKCHRSDFDGRYADMNACEDEFVQLADGASDLAGLFSNDYDEEGGTDCVHAIRSATCSEFDAGACDISLVWH